MGDAEKLIVGILAAIIVIVLGFFVIRAVFPKKQTVLPVNNNQSNQMTPTPTPSLISSTPTPTPGQGSTQSLYQQQPVGSTGYQVIQSQGNSNSSDNQGNQSQSQNGSGQSQTQTLPNGMTQSQNQ